MNDELDKTKHNPYGYLIGTELLESQVKEGRYIAGRKWIYGKYELAIDLILSVNAIEESKTPNRLVTASRNYPEFVTDSPVYLRITTYCLSCPNPAAKQSRSRILHIGGYEGPRILTEGSEFDSLMSRLKTKDFKDQLANSL